ncbi:hypothetical protein MBM_00825 [Drepanopeziza brunnea f. sp. 'multigermtubi' MB_m1]|uniref:Uncharacterized protein n=1 Tax=Marssonina brunnea f. sp. multigermtubi (strain MB_m1) TaxID=1072389 RepID=K1X9P5_MARBU|nr:uncharacterized protein MBM_00825 [Drepanopeziza brunnea f. sp. 'multigermtubi' MB_m1]EKD21712.1 hypothetical protein MBM_00825 [Drepanopeziza brunnea f. sp. 'multigermtubi' MB_m1]
MTGLSYSPRTMKSLAVHRSLSAEEGGMPISDLGGTASRSLVIPSKDSEGDVIHRTPPRSGETSRKSNNGKATGHEMEALDQKYTPAIYPNIIKQARSNTNRDAATKPQSSPDKSQQLLNSVSQSWKLSPEIQESK